MPQKRTRAIIGHFYFHQDFSDPIVDVSQEARTVTHETINGNNIVQVMGRDPPEIAIEGLAYDHQLEQLDELLSLDEIPVLTERWTGMAVVEALDTSFRREAEPETGNWVYDVNIDLLGVKDYLEQDVPPQSAESGSYIRPSDLNLYREARNLDDE